jgi:hypothetical protein
MKTHFLILLTSLILLAGNAGGQCLVITDPAPVCAGTTVDLSDGTITAGSLATTITYWENAEATTAYTSYNAATAGTYYIKGEGGTGCPQILPVKVVNDVVVGGSIDGSDVVCSGTNSVLLQLSGYIGNIDKWQYSTDGWITSSDIDGTSGSESYTVSNLTSSTKYRAVISNGACSPVFSSEATITVNALPSVTSPAVYSVCSGTSTSINLTADIASTFEWTVGTITGDITGATAGSGSTINQNLINGSSVSAGTVEYLVIPKSDGGLCTGDEYSIIVTVNPTIPVIVSIAASANPICSGTSVTFTATLSTDLTAPHYQWYKNGSTTGTDNNLFTYKPANGDAVYVVLTSSESCISGTATSGSVNMTVFSSSPSKPSMAGKTTVCSGSTETYSVALQDDVLNYEWTVDPGATIVSGQGTASVNISFDGTSSSVSVSVKAQNTCGDSSPKSSSINVRSLPIATISSSLSTVCKGASSPHITFNNGSSTGITVTYNINGGSPLTINVSPSGSSSVSVSTATATTYNYNILSVAYSSGEGCPTTVTGSASVTVTPAVGTPTAITIAAGSDPTCQLTNGTTTTTYTTTATNATGFIWSLSNPSAGSIDASTGVITWSSGFYGSANIQVKAEGCIGPSAQVARTVNVTRAVGTPTAITVSAGTEPTCRLTSGTVTTTYSTTATNSTGLLWSLSTSAAGSINASTGEMTWTNGFSGMVNIQVIALGCGTSSQVSRTVVVTPDPGTPSPITVSSGIEPACQITASTPSTTYATTASNSSGFSWSVSNPAAGSINSSTGVMTWTTGFSGTVNIQVEAIGCNGNSPQTLRTVNITPSVGTPSAITLSSGTEPNCLLSSGTTMTLYSTTASNATGYTWALSNLSAGSIEPTTGMMTWTLNFSGTVNIQVAAHGCGTSSTVIRTVNVHPLPVITLTGPVAPRINSTDNEYVTEPGMTSYLWSVSAGGSGHSLDNKKYVNWNTTGNQTVSVNYTDLNGCTAINPKVLNINVKPLPAATNVRIDGYPAAGATLEGKYDYSDGSSGSELSTYRWLRNGTDPIPLATSKFYIAGTDDINKTLTFEVTPVSSAGPPFSGGVVRSAPTALVEDLTGKPEALEVCIEGIRAEGSIISGEYTYEFSKSEGISTFRWLKIDTLTGTIQVLGTARQYTLVAGDLDDSKDIVFEVTPVSSNITPIIGDPVRSRPMAKIIMPKTDYSISEPDVILKVNERGGVFSGSGVIGNVFSPLRAGASAVPYVITYFLNIVNTSSTCSQQASRNVIVNPISSSFTGFNDVYCHDGPLDVVSVTGVPSDATERIFSLTNPAAVVSLTTGSITIDPKKFKVKRIKDVLTFSYKHLGVFYKIEKEFTVDSVGEAIKVLNLDSAYCSDHAKEYLSVEGIYPLGGSAEWTGAILSDTKTASAYVDPALVVPGTYHGSYRYVSAGGCAGKLITFNVKINALPNPDFNLDSTYNIETEEVRLIPLNGGGVFSGKGVSGDKLFPSIAGTGDHDIEYTITDANKCTSSLSHQTTIRQAEGSFSGIPSVICYSDTSYNMAITDLPASGLSNFALSNKKATLVYTPGSLSADYSVPLAGEGLDTLIFSYKWDGVDYSIRKALVIDKLDDVIIRNLSSGDTICSHLKPFELFPSVAGGVFDGPVSGGYLDPARSKRIDTVSYSYTNLRTGCSRSTSVPIFVFPSPVVNFAPVDVCINSDTDTTLFINSTTSTDAIESWLWEFSDDGAIHNSEKQNGGYLFKNAGLQQVSLTATTINGCSVNKLSTFNIGKKPEADFYFKNECMHPGESVVLVDTTKSISPVVSGSWRIFGGAEFSTAQKFAYYPKLDTGYLKIEYIVKAGYENCFDTVVKSVYIRPTITVSADGYFEDFESGKHGWVKDETTSNSWTFNTPDRAVIDHAYSGYKSWFTRYAAGISRQESSSVISPCFNFVDAERPFISLKLWKRFERDRAGAALQYRIGDSKEWHYVGTIDDGIGWYNSAVIRGEPGGNQLGWTSVGTPDDSWKDALHTLDELSGKKDVKFRISYGSDGSVAYDGVAFDDIRIGERNREVLLEHFTNVSGSLNQQTNELVNTISENKGQDVINIQYHTNFPGTDPFYNQNPGDASARILFYGLVSTPYTFVDGGGDRVNFARAFDNNLIPLDSNTVTKRSLFPSDFSITLNTIVSNGVLSLNGSIKALRNIADIQNLALFIAVTEKVRSENGTIYHNLFRKFLPDAGGIKLKSNWSSGENFNIGEQAWVLRNIADQSDIEVVAFIQNVVTREVFQAFSVIKPQVIVGIEDDLYGESREFSVNPNPAGKRITVSFGETLRQNAEISFLNIRGDVVKTLTAGNGTEELTIENPGLIPGLYFIKVRMGNKIIGYKKLVIIDN